MSQAWLDTKYLSLLSFKLRNYRRTNKAWNFSCPFCGDSKTDKRKARGYVYNKKGKLKYYCHNCGIPGIDVPKLVKHLDQNLFDEYIKEKLLDKHQNENSELHEFVNKMKKPSFIKDTPLNKLKKISQLSPDSVVKQYIEKRKIPTQYHHKLFYCSKFKHWVNEFKPEQFESLDYDEPRLIIPFLDKENNLFAVQGRSFNSKSNLRYITIMFDEEKPKIYGLETLNEQLTIYVVEGPIDSMFIPNCIASAGSDITVNLDTISTDKSKFVIVYDNEPRNDKTVAKMEKAINAGYPVCIWPEDLPYKDINLMHMKGMSIKKIHEIINDSTYTGLQAKVKLQQWKKV